MNRIVSIIMIAMLMFGSSTVKGAEPSEDVLKRAEQNDLHAIYGLASHYYYQGHFSEAARWYLRGAELGHPAMQNMLGHMYLQGQGVPADEREAIRWLSAASGSVSVANMTLAEIYANGRGTDKDLVEALARVEIALRTTDPKSNRELFEKAKALEREIIIQASPAQIESARSKARARRPDLMRQ